MSPERSKRSSSPQRTWNRPSITRIRSVCEGCTCSGPADQPRPTASSIITTSPPVERAVWTNRRRAPVSGSVSFCPGCATGASCPSQRSENCRRASLGVARPRDRAEWRHCRCRQLADDRPAPSRLGQCSRTSRSEPSSDAGSRNACSRDSTLAGLSSTGAGHLRGMASQERHDPVAERVARVHTQIVPWRDDGRGVPSRIQKKLCPFRAAFFRSTSDGDGLAVTGGAGPLSSQAL